MTSTATRPTPQVQHNAWFDKQAPEMAGKWRDFLHTVDKTGQLDKKTKELISVAIASADRCPHCTRGHIQAAQQQGASKEQISEAMMVSSLIASGAEMHWMIDEFNELLGADGQDQPWFAARTGDMAGAWKSFHEAVYEDSALDRKTKELVAVAAACAARCPHCTKAHIQAAQKHDASKQEISEALMVTALLASGTQLNWMKEDFEQLLA